MKGLMISKDYLDIRAGRIAYAMSDNGIHHDGLCFRFPVQSRDAYASLHVDAYMRYDDVVRQVRSSDADIIHVHGELSGMWLTLAAKDGADGRPVVLNVHDLTAARIFSVFDPYEPQALRAADALVWVCESYRDYAITAYGKWEEKPECFVTNYVSSRAIVTRPTLPHIGGVCSVGGVAMRGARSSRDLSPVSDALGGNLHIYGGGHDCDYGIVHDPEVVHSILMQRIATHDFGFAGTPEPSLDWEVTLATRVTEYMAAGIPGIYLNHPIAKEFAERGLGVYCENLRHVKQAASLDPKQFRKEIEKQRRQFTTEAIIQPLVDMYGSLT